MGLKSKPILFKFDFIGCIPEFRILDERRYKSIFSGFLSILLILFSIIFFCYSLIEFINQNPKVEYYKSNDHETNKTFEISNSLLMIYYSFICFSNMTMDPEITIILQEGEHNYEHLALETCELGKNLNLKYKELIEKFEKVESQKLEDFYCVNYGDYNLNLFSNPSLKSGNENLLRFKIETKCEDYFLQIILVTENDFIDHNQKENPIVPYYQKNELKFSNEKINVVYNFQYIKYESDNGFILNDKTTVNGIGFSGFNAFDKEDISNPIFSINFKMNRTNYDLYKRTFVKFQSFLADVMSLINLLIAISKVITEFLLYKKMHKDIIKYIISNKDIKENNQGKQIISNKKKFKKIFEMENNKAEKFEKKIEQNQIIEEKMNSKVSLENQNKDFILEFEDANKNMIKVMKNLNFVNIIKSFFCFKDKKLKLINLCNEIVMKNICVERILKRIYLLENGYNSMKEGDKNKSFIDNDIPKIKNIIRKINNNETSKQMKNKYGHFFKENNIIKK